MLFPKKVKNFFYKMIKIKNKNDLLFLTFELYLYYVKKEKPLHQQLRLTY